MQTRARLYDLLDYEAYNHFDTGVFNFQILGSNRMEHASTTSRGVSA